MIAALTVFLLFLDPHKAREKPLGSDVHLEGNVTVPSGALSSLMNDNGFVLGDHITGIYVVSAKKGYYSVGTALEVTGTLARDSRGMLVLRARSISLQKGRRLVKPWKMASPSLSEFYEGKIVRAEGDVVSAPIGQSLILRTGHGSQIQVLLLPGAQSASLSPGQRIQVTGFCIRNNQTYEIVVRSEGDIKPAGKK